MNGQAQTRDADGNLTVFQLSAAQPVILNGYDSENRMVSTETAGNTRIDNRYDPLHRRVLKRVSTWDSGSSTWVLQKTVRFTYDHWNVIEEEEITASATRTVRYTWGTDVSGTLQGAGGVGGLLRSDETIGTNPVSTHYFWYDGNGNVTGLMRSNGTIDATYRYTAFGGKASVAFTSGTFGERNRYRFSTKYLDDEVETVEGTYYYGYRHYLTALGKWGARDPIGERGGINLYGMVGNDIIDFKDFLGLTKGQPPTFDPNDPDFSGPNEGTNNCYNYAVNRPADPFSDPPIPPRWQPGPGSNSNPSPNKTCSELIDKVKKDRQTSPVKTNTKGKECCDKGYHLISVFRKNDGTDFHFRRKNQDGKWSEKPGYAKGSKPRAYEGDPNKYSPNGDDYESCGKLCVEN